MIQILTAKVLIIGAALALIGPVNPAAACSPASLGAQLRGSDAVVEGRVVRVRTLRVWVQDWRLQTLREAQVRPIRTLRGRSVDRTFSYRFSSLDPVCGSPDRTVREGQTVVFLFGRVYGPQPFSILTQAEYAAPDLDDRFS